MFQWTLLILAIYYDFRALSRRIINEFTNAQHPLNMAGVSKRWQKKTLNVIKLLPTAQLVTTALDNMKTVLTSSARASKNGQSELFSHLCLEVVSLR